MTIAQTAVLIVVMACVRMHVSAPLTDLKGTVM